MTQRRIEAVAYTDIGYVREQNEDTAFINSQANIYGVCDGIGGLEHGKDAAEMVREFFLNNNLSEKLSDSSSDQALLDAISDIDQEVGFRNFSWYVQYGCTLCGVWIKNENQVTVFHLGDSRCYIWRKNSHHLELITRDHNLAQDGLETNKKAFLGKKECRQNIITRYIGNPNGNTVDFLHLKLAVGDRILLCTDGLYNAVSEKEMKMILYNNMRRQVTEFGQEFIKAALDAGGNDNITLLMLDIMEEKENENVHVWNENGYDRSP